METFLSSLSNELFKLRRRKKYLVFLILGCAICVISALRVLLVNYLTDGSVDPAAVLGGLMSSNLTFILLIFLPLMAVMAASDLFVAEQADHTIRFSLMRPVGKGKLFFSKALAVFVLCAVDLGVMYLVTTLAQVVLGGGDGGHPHQPGGLPAGFGSPGGAHPLLLPAEPGGPGVWPHGAAVPGLLHRSPGAGDLPPRGGRPGVHRVSPVAQPVDRHHPALLLPAAPDGAAGGIRAGVRLRRVLAL